MDQQGRQRLLIIILLLLVTLALIGEAMNDRATQFYLGLTILGTAALVALMWVAVAFWNSGG